MQPRMLYVKKKLPFKTEDKIKSFSDREKRLNHFIINNPALENRTSK